MATARRKGGEAAAKRHPREEARKARNDLYRQHILGAAENVFAERGFEAAKVQEISDRAGLSMGTIYAQFTGKADLYGALLEERGGEMVEVARAAAAENGSAKATLLGLVRAYVHYFVSHPDFLRMHLRQGTSWVLIPALAIESRVQYWNQIHELQSDIFRRGVAAGEFVEEDPGYLAKLFTAVNQVLLSDWADGGMKEGEDRLVQRLERLVERTFCA